MTVGYIGIVSIFLIYIIISGFIPEAKSGASCNEDSWHYFSLTILDSCQTVLLLIMTTIIYCRSKAAQS